MTLTGQETYVKENYMLSRQRATVFTQMSTDVKNRMPMPEMVFKGKGTRIHLNPPDSMEVQWSPSGSYRLDTMLGTISHLENRYNIFTAKDFAVYILDDYSVHVTEEVRHAMLARGYILVVIGGGITGDIQINDTHLHHPLKQKYRARETTVMLEQLSENPDKIPAPSRDVMMHMLADSWDSLTMDPLKCLKNNFVCNAFDGSEDFMVSDKLFQIVGAEMVEFREALLKTTAPMTVEKLMKTITPPKGVRIREASVIPPDEGKELYDCKGEEIGEEEMHLECEEVGNGDDDDDDEAGGETTVEPLAAVPVTSVPLKQLTSNASINADGTFLDDLQELFEKHATSTSTLFVPYFCQFKATCSRARRALKKRIMSDTTTVVSAEVHAEEHADEDEVSDIRQHDNSSSSERAGSPQPSASAYMQTEETEL